MNSFEKTIIGVAKTDQSLNKVQNIVGMVSFLAFATLIVIVAVVIHKNGKNQKVVAQKVTPTTAQPQAVKNTEQEQNINQ